MNNRCNNQINTKNKKESDQNQIKINSCIVLFT